MAEKERNIQEYGTRERDLQEELSNLKKDLDAKQRKCQEYILEIEKTNQQKTDLQTELNTLQGKVFVFSLTIRQFLELV